MARRSFTPEQIIHKLREAEVLVAQGVPAQQAARQMGVSEQTFYRWRKEYGGFQMDQGKRLKALERENSRLKRLVAEKELDIQIFKETLALDAKNC
jgi:transposase-like protein|tara:strand:- start:560 stop:847 length:288 start_codon:yes stop_codon:yes gene_type:complete